MEEGKNGRRKGERERQERRLNINHTQTTRP
jgi:hypothetical protein